MKRLTAILIAAALLGCGFSGVTDTAAAGEGTGGDCVAVWGYVDDGCQLLPGATVVWRCYDCFEEWTPGVADDQGIYRCYGPNLETHLYHYVRGEATAPGKLSAAITYTSWPGSPALVSFTLEPLGGVGDE